MSQQEYSPEELRHYGRVGLLIVGLMLTCCIVSAVLLLSPKINLTPEVEASFDKCLNNPTCAENMSLYISGLLPPECHPEVVIRNEDTTHIFVLCKGIPRIDLGDEKSFMEGLRRFILDIKKRYEDKERGIKGT